MRRPLVAFLAPLDAPLGAPATRVAAPAGTVPLARLGSTPVRFRAADPAVSAGPAVRTLVRAFSRL